MIESALTELETINNYKREDTNHIAFFGSARIREDSCYYEDAKHISYSLAKEGWQVISGGGPGIMRAVSEGAERANKHSIGLNISLPFEPADYSLQKDSFVFQNFFTRKFAFASYADAFICLPGGMGTLDELFEVLTLMQTEKLTRKPIILFGEDFWLPLIDWLKNIQKNFETISKNDIEQLFVTNSTEEAITHLNNRLLKG